MVTSNEIIRIVSQGLAGKSGQKTIIHKLIVAGVPPEMADETYRVVEHGIKSGVTKAFAGERKAKVYSGDHSDLHAAAVCHGMREYAKVMRLIWVKRIAMILLVIIAICIGLQAILKH